LLSPVLYEGLLEVDKRVRGYVLVAKHIPPWQTCDVIV